MAYIQSNSVSSYSNAAQTYFNLLGSTPQDAARIDQFFRALTAAGLDTYLVDGCFCRTTQNLTSGTDLKTIRGVSATTVANSPDIGANGVVLNGSNQYINWAVSDTTASSIACTYKGLVSGQIANGSIWTYYNSLGLGTGAGTCGMALLFAGAGSPGYGFTINQASATTTSSIVDPTSSSASTVDYGNPYEQINILTNDNAASPTLKAYVDGKLCITDSSGNTQALSTRTRFAIGVRPYDAGVGGLQSYARGTWTNWFLFNKVLSDTEAKALSDAMRWLNPKTKNIVYIGDSTSAFLQTKPSDAWTYQYSILKKNADARIYNVAVNGQSTTFFNTNYDDFIKRYRPWVNGVEESVAFVWLGINDINGGSTDSTTYTALKSLWSKLKRDGFRVFVMSLMPGTGYDVTKEGYRTALNTSILSDPGLYDNVYRPDLFFPDRNDTTIYLDTFHLLTEANRELANWISTDVSEVNIRPNTYPLTDAATIATDCSLIPHTAICTVTLGGNRTLGAPTNPTHGRRLTYRFLQDGTGSRTLALNAVFNVGPWTVTLTTTANKADYLEVIYNAIAVKWEVVNFQKGY